MTGIQPYQFEPEGTLQDEDDSDESSKKALGELGTLIAVYVNSVY